ncbi:hypothetical protein EMPS_10672 [Entomortierella parvispora]|uniref:Uncharacterized protein n=1 Tax=Entomortierella parvispora TaxID=205924 RepID=A0A9P3HKS3_9FUNG|nr:hypothetical protein EMPS_10672 [Entomortierella parvispora]
MQGRAIDDYELPDIKVQCVEDVLLLEQVLTLLSKPTVLPVDCGAMFLHLDEYSVVAPELKEPDQGANDIIEQLSRCLKIGLYVLFLKCQDMLGIFARDALEGKDTPPEVPLIVWSATPASFLRGQEYHLLTVGVTPHLSHPRHSRYSSGEFICVSTTVQKRYLSQPFQLAHDTKSGRNVDLPVDGLGLEVVTEAKPNMDRSPCERQFLKNLRIKHAIHIVAAERGLQLPKMNQLDVRGMSTMVCALHSQGDIFLGDAASENIIDLPTNKAELSSLLSSPFAILLWCYTVTSPGSSWSIFLHTSRVLIEVLCLIEIAVAVPGWHQETALETSLCFHHGSRSIALAGGGGGLAGWGQNASQHTKTASPWGSYGSYSQGIKEAHANWAHPCAIQTPHPETKRPAQ